MAQKVISIEDRIPKLKEQRKRKANRRLAWLLLLFFLLVSLFAYFQSPISKVGSITVSGNKLVNDERIISESGITKKTVVLNMRKGKAEKALSQLPEIKKVHIKLSFPNKVHISVEEFERIGFLEKKGNLFPLLENGELAGEKEVNPLEGGPILKDFKENDLIYMATEQLVKIPIEIRNAISEMIYSPTKTDKHRIILFMNDGFEVHATLRTFSEKMKYYPSLIKQLNPEEKGIIDLEVGMFFKSYQSIIQQDENVGGDENEN